jgi:hypothetical protein
MAFNNSSYGLFQGQLFGAARILNGAQIGGYLPFGDTDKFEISPKQKFEDIEESQTGLGLTSAHIPVTTQINVSINVLDIKFENWAKAVWGTHGGAVEGSTVSGEEVMLYPGSYCPLAHPGVSGVNVSVGTEGVDYTVDSVNGGLMVLPGSGAITSEAGVAATVDYIFADYGGRVQAFTRQQPIFKLRLNGINTANSGQPVIANIFQWAPDMAKMLAMIEKKRMSFELDGMLLQDTTKPIPTPEAPFSQFFEIVKA